ncbi:dynamin-like protein 6 [Actinidia rufa]|uniref:dynamin GTPase n=1 Tax=Actinidia rufa TaxID=165716 RepID=A0A7J0GFG0_9ERIC|nr:dynamin-like protein 6 [Actinidia rufa]
MDAIDELAQLSDSMRQASSLLADEDVEENPSSSSRRSSTFLNVVALGNICPFVQLLNKAQYHAGRLLARPYGDLLLERRSGSKIGKRLDGRARQRHEVFDGAAVEVNNGAGKSAVLNSLIGHPALPTGEGGATRAPICIDLARDGSLSSKSIILQIDSKNQQDRLSKSSGKSCDEIHLKLSTSTAPPLKLIDLPGIDKGSFDVSLSAYVEHNDAVLLVIIPASLAPEISSYKALRIAKEYDGESTRTVGVISKIDQAASEPKILAAVQALLLGQGPRSTSDIPWVALIGQTVSIASSQSGNAGSESSLETAWRAESESLKSILTGAPQSKLGRLALVETLAHQIRNRMKVRLPNLLSGYLLVPATAWLQGKSQVVEDELVRLGEQMVHSAEGTRALALELCREFEDKFLQHITTGEGPLVQLLKTWPSNHEVVSSSLESNHFVHIMSNVRYAFNISPPGHPLGNGWKIVASFEGNFPKRIQQLPLDRHFDINNVKRIVLEADGYQPYLISPEKGLRSLIKIVLELAKEPARLCVDEVHRVLVDIVSAAANGTPGLGRYPPFKREVVAIASAALDGFKNEAKNMVLALVDMERAFVPPQHFIRLVQRRMERQRQEEEQKNRSSRKAVDAEQSILNKASSPQTGGQQAGGSLKSMKDKPGQQDKDMEEGSGLKTAGPDGEITAGLYRFGFGLLTLEPRPNSINTTNRGFLLKKSAKKNGWSRKWFVLNEKTGKLGYTKKQEERHFHGVITLEFSQGGDEVSDEVGTAAEAGGDVAGMNLLGLGEGRARWKEREWGECNIEEVSEEEDPPSKSSKDKKAIGADSGKAPSLVFKITSKVPYKTVLKAHNGVLLKAESMADKVGWLNKLGIVVQPSKGGQLKGDPSIRQSLSDGSLETMARRPADPEEELRWMVQEVRRYVEAVLNSLAANVPKAVVFCQVEKSKEDMLNKLYSSISAQSMSRIEELLQEDQRVKGRRERYQKQSSLLSKLTRQLSIHDNRAAAASTMLDSGTGSESSPRTSGPGDDWRSAFDAAANGPTDDSRYGSNGHNRRYTDPTQKR